MRNLLTDIPGIAVGHATDIAAGTGATAILFDEPATASAVILGGAPGSRDTALLEPEMTQQRVSGFVLSGGSLFGLDAAGGVQAWLREQGRGIAMRGLFLPIVPQAILFDLLNGGDKGWGRYSPYAELGYAAAADATHDSFALGSVGAGTGASTSTLKGGIGSASMRTAEGYTVAAIVAVNAVGTATIGDGPHFWAAPFEVGAEFGGLGLPTRFTAADLAPRLKGMPQPATATTIGLVATDAELTKAQCKRLAIMANDGLARAVFPAHAPSDGDTVFASATGAVKLAEEMHLTLIGHAATQVFARAIARGVFEATALPYPPGVPSWKDRFGR